MRDCPVTEYRLCGVVIARVVHGVDPLVAPVAESREEGADGDSGAFGEFVVGRTRCTPAAAVIDVVAEVVAGVMRGRASRGGHGLDIVDAAAVVVVGKSGQSSQPVIGEEAFADGCAALVNIAAADDVSVATDAIEGDGRRVGCGLGDQVDRAADAVAVNVGLESLVDLH